MEHYLGDLSQHSGSDFSIPDEDDFSDLDSGDSHLGTQNELEKAKDGPNPYERDLVFKGDRVMSRKSMQQAPTMNFVSWPEVFSQTPIIHSSRRLEASRSSATGSPIPLANQHEVMTFKTSKEEVSKCMGKIPRSPQAPTSISNQYPSKVSNESCFNHLEVLDEYGPTQSDPAVITLQLRAASLQFNSPHCQVASIQNADKYPKKLDAWISSIKDLYRIKPPPSVSYSKPMPDIDKLMQEWSIEIEKALMEVELPTDNLDVDLNTFSDICCSILDIPVYKSRVESLHLMFSLYLELKENTYYSSLSQH
ncbi:hypothetical protein O6H91_09G113300 [Diphasiastrum complanatum]|uniref:Uncharacterized protein n=2 Tax=Diphasiastrum complanatum TaxID=34168 RepID=A0ACC2CTR8_DIPCM|nr:hypothetical protein O6H91_09G113300 [Diphasiastrum complanatum]KAJ7545273.1 hypothetical protein O6H91_09G113300 [Diphasiastrum complanatum]